MPATFAYESSPPRSAPTLLHPVLALVLYRGNGVCALKHEIHATSEVPVLGAATPLTAQERVQLIQALGGQVLTAVQANTLAVSPVGTVWWCPPGKHFLLFQPKYPGDAGIQQLSGQAVPLPGLVLIASPGKLRVYAVSGEERPTLDTPLFHAPLWNLFSSGEMCRGSVVYPEQATPAEQAAWEGCFFGSVFTGPSRTDRYMAWGASYQELLEQAMQAGQFPENVLIPVGKTLREVSA